MGRGLMGGHEGGRFEVRYEGEFKDGKQHGRGLYQHADGNRYVGQFKNDNFHGRGTILFVDGSRYEGIFKEGKPRGRGVLRNKAGAVIQEKKWSLDELLQRKKMTLPPASAALEAGVTDGGGVETDSESVVPAPTLSVSSSSTSAHDSDGGMVPHSEEGACLEEEASAGGRASKARIRRLKAKRAKEIKKLQAVRERDLLEESAMQAELEKQLRDEEAQRRRSAALAAARDEAARLHETVQRVVDLMGTDGGNDPLRDPCLDAIGKLAASLRESAVPANATIAAAVFGVSLLGRPARGGECTACLEPFDGSAAAYARNKMTNADEEVHLAVPICRECADKLETHGQCVCQAAFHGGWRVDAQWCDAHVISRILGFDDRH